MRPFFTRERFGSPQIYAGLLLLAFAAQGLWFMTHMPLERVEQAQVDAGQSQWRGDNNAGDVERSPLVPLIAAVPTALRGGPGAVASSAWLVRLPFLAMGILLGASLWYVARRLYGNAGGYIALALYVFCPVIIQRSATVHPEIAAAWGTFGAVFTAIAVSHTLYAPREVVLWNWRRILLLGVALGFAIGAQFALWVIALLALAFMLYLVPERRGAAVAILSASCLIAFLLIWTCYFFHPAELADSLIAARFMEFQARDFALPVTWKLLWRFFFPRMPGVLVLLAVALITFAAWRRTRFFGTAAPLLTALVLVVLSVAMPHLGGYTFLLVMLPFAFVFVAGVFADLLETKASGLVLGVVLGVLLAYAMFSVGGLVMLP